MGKKRVREIDYYTGEELRVFDSQKEACKFHLIRESQMQYAFNKANGKMRNLKLSFERINKTKNTYEYCKHKYTQKCLECKKC